MGLNADVVRAFDAAWDTEGFGPAFSGFIHPDGIWQNNVDPPRQGLADVMAGIDQYLQVFQRPYARVELLHLAIDGDVVLTERIEHCENRETGDTYVGRHMSSFEIRDGKIVRFNDYFDPTDYRDGNALPRA